MIRLLLTTVLLAATGLFAAAQDCKCSLNNELRPRLIQYFNQGKFDSAQVVLDQLRSEKSPACQIAFWDGSGQVRLAKKELAEGLVCLKQAAALIDQHNCLTLKVVNYNSIARYYQEVSKHDSVMHYSYLAIEAAKAVDNWRAVIMAQISIGSIFAQNKAYDKSMQWYEQALQTSIERRDSSLLDALYVRLAGTSHNLYQTSKDRQWLDKMKNYARQGVGASQKSGNILELMAAYLNLAKYHTNRHPPDSVAYYCQKVIRECPHGNHNLDRILAEAFNIYGEALYEQKQYAQAMAYADSAYHYALLFNKQVSISPLELMHKTAKASGDYKKALFAFEAIKATRDSLFTLEKNKAIYELEQKYDQSQNEQTILRLDNQRRILWLGLLLAALAAFGVFFYFRNRMLQQKQIILETEQRLNRARMNPHFFFNALASLQSFAINESDSIVLAENLSKFSHIMRETLENTYREYVTIQQEQDFLSEYLELQQIRFPGKFEFSIRSDEAVEAHRLLIPSMIVQPFVENCIEHGFANIDYKGNIDIEFSKKDQGIAITVYDNGKGLNYGRAEAKPHISRASQIIKDRIYLLNLKLKSNASFFIKNNAKGGVTVSIVLPVIYEN
jgi:Histidine kinase